MTTTLKTVVFMGSSRSLVPPWGGDSRLGSRVLQCVAMSKGEAGSAGQRERACLLAEAGRGWRLP